MVCVPAVSRVTVVTPVPLDKVSGPGLTNAGSELVKLTVSLSPMTVWFVLVCAVTAIAIGRPETTGAVGAMERGVMERCDTTVTAKLPDPVHEECSVSVAAMVCVPPVPSVACICATPPFRVTGPGLTNPASELVKVTVPS